MVNDFICFDTESAQGRARGEFVEEIIEISILNAAKESVFYNRFKPTRISKWDTSIHHITPAMLADKPHFSKYSAQLQKIFDSTRYVIGFSLIDDYKALGKAGLTNLENKRDIELRHLYWYCIGRHNGIPFYSGPGLSQCAIELNVDINAEAVHSADGDTRVTLDLFFALIKLFAEQENINHIPDPEDEAFIDFIELMLKRVAEAKYQYDREMAAGYILVIPCDDGAYKIVSSKSQERENDNPVLTIRVCARKRAMFEIERQFSRRRIANTKLFRLTTKDIETISHYKNEFDNRESMYQKLLGLQRTSSIQLR